ncbi:L-threonylcarbamoyladenylate synthase [Nocardioides panacis]|uniref:L-threonylcarbamoyladenylate synthase n=1 Tax=Nocardioides panacis TaxID=2849501 RepID=UPI00345EE361
MPDVIDDQPAAQRFSTAEETEREAGIANAALAVQRGQLVVLPTDTVYGIGADAFDPESVRRLLAAKGRGREMPPPVLVSAPTTLDALAVGVPSYARALITELWPGPLTLVCRQQPSLQWDLGDTRGTVAVRMPDHEVALELLARTGPLAVSSANRTGLPAATDADQAEAMLGSSVAVILDGGPTPGALPSTIVDVTGPAGRVLRLGAVSLERLNEIVAPLGVEISDEG